MILCVLPTASKSYLRLNTAGKLTVSSNIVCRGYLLIVMIFSERGALKDSFMNSLKVVFPVSNMTWM